LINVLKSELRYSNPFRNASVPNERRSSNCGRVTVQFSHSSQYRSVTDRHTDTHTYRQTHDDGIYRAYGL